MSKTPRRPYRKRKRAQSEEETRRRITEAAVELHGTVGPANTTVTEVARVAGVSRMTVYNHFPTDADLFEACSTHWAAHNPFPDPSGWSAIDDPCERLAGALEELYAWYGRTERMLENVLRDAALIPPVGEVMDRLWGPYMERVIAAMALGWSPAPEGERALHAMLRVAADFNTWRVLAKSGMNHRAAARLAAGMVTGALTHGSA